MSEPSDQYLQQDSRIKLLFGEIPLSEFAKKLPSMSLRDEVNNDVVEAFKIVEKLLIHSYYEYLFIDIAVTKALHTLEMALKIRYKEINAQEWKASLQQLLEWFRSRNYFERDDTAFFDQVRRSRNHLSHPNAFKFGGTAFLPWIDTIVGLVNDIYDDLDLRSIRKNIRKQLSEKLRAFAIDGASLRSSESATLFYAPGGVFVNNKVTPQQYWFTLLPIFDHTSTQVKIPVLFQVENLELFDQDEIVVGFEELGNSVVLTKCLSDTEKAQVLDFRKECEVSDPHMAIEAMMLHEADMFFRGEIRKMRLAR